MNFQPNDPFDDAAKAAVDSNLGRSLGWPATAMTRAQAAQWIAAQLGWL
jgi:hypothetical protein